MLRGKAKLLPFPCLTNWLGSSGCRAFFLEMTT